MARDDDRARLRRVALLRVLDGTRPSGTLDWVSPVVPAVTQAAVGAGHWAAGRRRRALAAWACAAGFALVAWGLGAEAPTQAEADMAFERDKELARSRSRGATVPQAAESPAPVTLRTLQVVGAATSSVRVIFDVRSGLRHPKRLTVLAAANEAPVGAFFALRAACAVARRRPRMAAGSALVVAGTVARLRAASAEPLQ